MTLRCFCLALGLTLASPGRAAAEAVAIVYGLEGTAFVTAAPSNQRRPIQRFEWLDRGAVIESAPGGRVRLAFSDGSRYELQAASMATVLGVGQLQSTQGSALRLPSVSPLPKIEIAADARPGVRAGALRLRGRRIEGLYPRDEAVVLGHAATLAFTPVSGIEEYKVQVEDESGALVFETVLGSSGVTLPANVLKAGGRYHWSVRSVGGSPSSRGDGDFGVLSAEGMATREALRRSLDGREDSDSLALLAEIDFRLGLLREALQGFQKALAAAPGDPSLTQAVDGIERQLLGQRRDP